MKQKNKRKQSDIRENSNKKQIKREEQSHGLKVFDLVEKKIPDELLR